LREQSAQCTENDRSLDDECFIGVVLRCCAAIAWFQSMELVHANNCATVLEISTVCVAVQQSSMDDSVNCVYVS
jgi:hypothetical protein